MSETNGGIYRKIAEVLGSMEDIPKTGTNPHFGYAFHEEQVIVEHLRPMLAEKGVVLVVRQGERHTEQTEKGGKVVVSATEVTFVDADDGSSFTARIWGEGQDTQDKGSHKALVGAFKYALMKTFLISAGNDDPEHDRGVSRSQGRSKSKSTSDSEYHCPDCGGPMWNNIADKEAGKVKPKYPDFKCKDKACDNAIWGSHPDDVDPAALAVEVQDALNRAAELDLLTLDQSARVEGVLDEGEADDLKRALDWLNQKLEVGKMQGAGKEKAPA